MLPSIISSIARRSMARALERQAHLAKMSGYIDSDAWRMHDQSSLVGGLGGGGLIGGLLLSSATHAHHPQLLHHDSYASSPFYSQHQNLQQERDHTHHHHHPSRLLALPCMETRRGTNNKGKTPSSSDQLMEYGIVDQYDNDDDDNGDDNAYKTGVLGNRIRIGMENGTGQGMGGGSNSNSNSNSSSSSSLRIRHL
jgi:hypothetical protein